MATPVQALDGTANAPVSVRVSWPALLSYSTGDVPITITMVLMGLFALFFYNSVMGLPGVLAGIGMFSGLPVDAVADPYIGFRSDTSKHRFGRRHVFMLAGALAMGPCFALLFSPPRGLGHVGLFIWLLSFSILFRTASAIYRIPYLSLGAEMTDDYYERTRVIAFRALFGLLGTLAAAALSFLLFFSGSVGGLDAKLDYTNYPRMGALFGCILTATGLLAVFGTLRFRTDSEVDAEARSVRDFFRNFATAFRNRSFSTLWVSATLFFAAVVINASVAVHYFTWYVRVSDSRAMSGIQSAFYVGAVAGVFGWLRLSKWLEKRTLYIVGMTATAVILAAATVLTGAGNLLGTGNVRILLIGHALAGIFASCLWVIPASMLADVGDEDELGTGTRREGILFGILNFGEKVAAGLAMLISGTLLHLYVGLQPEAANQSSTAVARIGIVYGILPGAMAIVATIIIARYRLNERAVASIQSQLADQRSR